MIAKHDLLASLQGILSLQQDLASEYQRLISWQPPDDAISPWHDEFAATCRTLELDARCQIDCIEKLCLSIARTDRDNYAA
jgi:hypothetical protein